MVSDFSKTLFVTSKVKSDDGVLEIHVISTKGCAKITMNTTTMIYGADLEVFCEYHKERIQELRDLMIMEEL
jgi:hypothetical protein